MFYTYCHYISKNFTALITLRHCRLIFYYKLYFLDLKLLKLVTLNTRLLDRNLSKEFDF